MAPKTLISPSSSFDLILAFHEHPVISHGHHVGLENGPGRTELVRPGPSRMRAQAWPEWHLLAPNGWYIHGWNFTLGPVKTLIIIFFFFKALIIAFDSRVRAQICSVLLFTDQMTKVIFVISRIYSWHLMSSPPDQPFRYYIFLLYTTRRR